jgi:hypothetical protein
LLFTSNNFILHGTLANIRNFYKALAFGVFSKGVKRVIMLTSLNKFVQRACTIQRVASDKERNITLPPIDDLDPSGTDPIEISRLLWLDILPKKITFCALPQSAIS